MNSARPRGGDPITSMKPHLNIMEDKDGSFFRTLWLMEIKKRPLPPHLHEAIGAIVDGDKLSEAWGVGGVTCWSSAG